jgi:predicted nucleic acid-binding Zn ribbon protein
MPTSHDRDKQEEIYTKNERRRNAIFKVLEPIFWLIVIIIVVTMCLSVVWAWGYFSAQLPTTF